MKLKNTYYCARFYITYRCNSKCTYCNVWRDKNFLNKTELSLEKAKQLIKECSEVGVKYIDFTGGEPTLYPFLAEVIEYAKSLGIKTEVTSNCVAKSLILQQRLNQVSKTVDKFNISLDTLDPDIYQKVRGIDACEQVKERIQEIAKFRQPKIMTVISDKNIEKLDEMIRFAQNNKSLIYLSPVFPYIDKNGKFVRSKYIKEITDKIFDPYTIVLLHFMEFFKNSDFKMIPPCSANKMTLTLSPSGNIVLPCYHSIKEELIWDRPIKELVKSEKFLSYQKESSLLPCCKGCRVIPYMGISYSYKYDKYFLLQSYSEKLSQLKKTYLNDIYQELNMDKNHLFKLLKKFVKLCHTLNTQLSPNNLYYAEKSADGYKTDIFKQTISEKEHQDNLEQEDCWHLKKTPVTFYNLFEQNILKHLKQNALKNIDVFQNVLEFQLRWWMYFANRYLNVGKLTGAKANQKWLKHYLQNVKQCDLPQESIGIIDNALNNLNER